MRVSSRTLSHWYPRLATALDAGLGLQSCLATMPGPPAPARAALATRLQAGEGLAEALEREARWLPSVDRQVIVCGAQAGRLPEALRRLAQRHEARVRAGTGIALAVLYPVALIHLGALAFPIQKLVDGSGLAAYGEALAWVLVPLWACGAAVAIAYRAGFRPLFELLNVMAVLGGFRRARALADLAFVLEALVVAGVRIDIAWLQAGIATGDRRLEPVAMSAAESVQRGEPVSPILAARREIPSLFAEYYRTGETSGRLDDSLRAIQNHFSDTAATKLKIVGMVYPALIFMAVAVWVAAKIVLFYAGHFQRYEELMR